jgi:hypothetical protein
MMKRVNARLSVLALAIATGLIVCGIAAAGPDHSSVSGLTTPSILGMISTTGDDAFSTMSLSPTDPSGTPTQHYGPYASGSPDSGTCGNDWATDTFDRDFTVRTANDGTITIVEQFKNGSFVTTGDGAGEGPSPGACDPTDQTPPGTIRAGVTGSMHGYFIISNVTPQTSSSPFCDAFAMTNDNCTTATFINTHFFPACYPAICTVTTFFDHYSAGDQGLVYHEWKNASCDRGGNHGDISDMITGPAPPPTPCVE